jgi:hypothetical protein
LQLPESEQRRAKKKLSKRKKRASQVNAATIDALLEQIVEVTHIILMIISITFLSFLFRGNRNVRDGKRGRKALYSNHWMQVADRYKFHSITTLMKRTYCKQ